MLIWNVWVKCSLTRNFFCFSKTVNLALSSHSEDNTVQLFLWWCLGAVDTWLRLGKERGLSNVERLGSDSRRLRAFNKHLKSMFSNLTQRSQTNLKPHWSVSSKVIVSCVQCNETFWLEISQIMRPILSPSVLRDTIMWLLKISWNFKAGKCSEIFHDPTARRESWTPGVTVFYLWKQLSVIRRLRNMTSHHLCVTSYLRHCCSPENSRPVSTAQLSKKVWWFWGLHALRVNC